MDQQVQQGEQNQKLKSTPIKLTPKPKTDKVYLPTEGQVIGAAPEKAGLGCNQKSHEFKKYKEALGIKSNENACKILSMLRFRDLHFERIFSCEKEIKRLKDLVNEWKVHQLIKLTDQKKKLYQEILNKELQEMMIISIMTDMTNYESEDI